MTSNYNHVYGVQCYRIGDIFKVTGIYRNSFRCMKFDGLKIINIDYPSGCRRLIFDYNEWLNNTPKRDKNILFEKYNNKNNIKLKF